MDHVRVELIPSNFHTRRGCDLGGVNEKEPFLCEVTEGEFEGFSVSPYYLPGRDGTNPDVDADLEAAAVDAEKWALEVVDRSKARAAMYRKLKGRLVLPTYDEFNAACQRQWAEGLKDDLASQTAWLEELRQMKKEGRDVDVEIEEVASGIVKLEAEIHELHNPKPKTPAVKLNKASSIPWAH